ncbi:hypothetical protein CH373_10870 [Leptospira perolatii]|uniref:Putative DNA-binding domain-containing protein n=1 Tax=Leptospira perolatii TaxID=2023191 RepID=A0A2M9ZLW3_9LEPT|nr:DNA-binding domain-containing protein [Leptospira perolatii]PJZ69786.1 hypothetical protein CH360_09365 [Leptospira perolatii]PJZ72999.1 hypothetical protein CH373_10870 [Leptospira perolatii]
MKLPANHEENFRLEFAKIVTSQSVSKDFLAKIQPSKNVSLETVLEVYSSGYLVRLKESLGETYETVWSVLGDEAFFSICEKYIKRTKSTSYNLSDYGLDFSLFLKLEVSEFPFLPVLAEFEWEFRNLFHSKGSSFLGSPSLPKDSSVIDMRIEFVQPVIFREHEFSVYPFWKNRKSNSFAELNFEWNQPEFLLMMKKGSEISSESISGWEFKLARLLREGKTLLEASEIIESEIPNPESVSTFFSRLLQGGFIQDIQCEY